MSFFLRSFDLYSTKFNFTIGRYSSYSTALGSFLSLITGIVFIALFIILGKDFLYKENPRSSTSNTMAISYDKITLYDYNITIAISLSRSESSEVVDLTGGFFWSDMTHYHRYLDKDSGTYFLNYTTIGLKSCNNLTYQPSMNFSNEFYCLEFPADSFFGSTGVGESYYLYAIYNCEKKAPIGFENFKCNSFDILKERFKQRNTIGYKFNIYHPVLYYDPRDKDHPARVNYELLSFPFDYNLQRTDSLYFHKTVVNQDHGWWFEENSNSTYWTVESKEYYFNYKSDDDLQEFFASSKFYSFNLYMSLKHNYYSRSYMKIQDVLAVSATILKLLMMVFEVICIFVNTPLIKYHIFNQLFSTNRIGAQKINNVSLYSNINLSKLNLVNASKFKESYPMTFVESTSTPVGMVKKRTLDEKITVKSYSHCFAFRRAFGTCVFNKNEKHLLDKFDKGNEIVKEKIDIDNYVKILYDIIILQKCLFNEAEFFSLNHLQRVNLFHSMRLDSCFNINQMISEENMRKYGKYFINQLDRGENCNFKDRFLLDMMKESYKAQLLSQKVDPMDPPYSSIIKSH